MQFLVVPYPVILTFKLVDNTSAGPLSDTFGNLPDGGTMVWRGNTFQANYERATPITLL
jgi:hypothetical protein